MTLYTAIPNTTTWQTELTKTSNDSKNDNQPNNNGRKKSHQNNHQKSNHYKDRKQQLYGKIESYIYLQFNNVTRQKTENGNTAAPPTINNYSTLFHFTLFTMDEYILLFQTVTVEAHCHCIFRRGSLFVQTISNSLSTSLEANAECWLLPAIILTHQINFILWDHPINIDAHNV